MESIYARNTYILSSVDLDILSFFKEFINSSTIFFKYCSIFSNTYFLSISFPFVDITVTDFYAVNDGLDWVLIAISFSFIYFIYSSNL